MGIDIDAFALDLGAFTKWTDRSVGDALFYIARNATVDDARVFIAFDAEKNLRYRPLPSRCVVRTSIGDPVQLSESDVAELPLLRQPLADYLKSGSVYDLKSLLYSLSTCAEISFVKLLTEGFRRWWIGSLLQTAKDLPLLSSDEQTELDDFLRKILHGWNCGYDLKRWSQGFGLDYFPFAPAEDPDTRLAVMSDAECDRLLTLIERILAQNSRFVPPSETSFGDDKTDWDGWVRLMLDAFLVMRTLRFRELRLLTFIG